jgi:hypothetical protein
MRRKLLCLSFLILFYIFPSVFALPNKVKICDYENDIYGSDLPYFDNISTGGGITGINKRIDIAYYEYESYLDIIYFNLYIVDITNDNSILPTDFPFIYIVKIYNGNVYYFLELSISLTEYGIVGDALVNFIKDITNWQINGNLSNINFNIKFNIYSSDRIEFNFTYNINDITNITIYTMSNSSVRQGSYIWGYSWDTMPNLEYDYIYEKENYCQKQIYMDKYIYLFSIFPIIILFEYLLEKKKGGDIYGKERK